MRFQQRPLPEQMPPLPGLPELLQRIYAARGVSSVDELDNGLRHLLPFYGLKGIEAAAELLVDAIRQQQRIVILGDFDADGATATAVAVLGLQMLGACAVHYLVPNRFDYSYGLSMEILPQISSLQPGLLITVDNGISSIEPVAAAKELGMRVLITDHHLAGEQLPAADAIVNPNQPGCTFPSKAMAGVGVIFYCLLAARARLRELGLLATPEPNLANLLDLVALGTVADVVPLDANNRRLVQQGLLRIRNGRMRPGIQALLELTGRDYRRLIASDLGFILGPRLNAAGRMDDMSLGIACLLAEQPQQAQQLAARLEQLNVQRKQTEQQMQQQALQQLADFKPEQLPFGLCVYEPHWHQGVSGILASRLRERYHRPVVVFAEGADGLLKGSARSINGLHIRDLLAALDTSHPHLMQNFGGHAMAAGLGLQPENYPEFARLFDQLVRQQLSQDQLNGLLYTDGQLQPQDFALDTAKQLRNAGPWGQHFPEPCFHGEFRLLQQRLVGERHLKMQVQEPDGGLVLDAIAFNIDPQQWPNPNVRHARIAYRLDVNEFRGQQSLQLIVEHLQQAL